MNNKIETLLDIIDEKSKKYGKGIFGLNKKLNKTEVKYFEKWIIKYLKNGFAEYIDFLKIINGFSYDGLTLFSLDDESEYNFYEINEGYWDTANELKQYIFFGINDLDYWLCKKTDNGKYYEVSMDEPNKEINEYETFNEIMIKILKNITEQKNTGQEIDK